MVDIVSKAARSRMMSSIRGKNTKPEMIVRKFLHGKGFRYRLHVRSLPGTPDLVLPKYNVAIFVHGCFWHRHEGCRYATVPDENHEKWRLKFEQNVARDRHHLCSLVQAGWRVIVVWECGLRTAVARDALEELVGLVREGGSPIVEWPGYAPCRRAPGWTELLEMANRRSIGVQG